MNKIFDYLNYMHIWNFLNAQYKGQLANLAKFLVFSVYLMIFCYVNIYFLIENHCHSLTYFNFTFCNDYSRKLLMNRLTVIKIWYRSLPCATNNILFEGNTYLFLWVMDISSTFIVNTVFDVNDSTLKTLPLKQINIQLYSSYLTFE